MENLEDILKVLCVGKNGFDRYFRLNLYDLALEDGTTAEIEQFMQSFVQMKQGDTVTGYKSNSLELTASYVNDKKTITVQIRRDIYFNHEGIEDTIKDANGNEITKTIIPNFQDNYYVFHGQYTSKGMNNGEWIPGTKFDHKGNFLGAPSPNAIDESNYLKFQRTDLGGVAINIAIALTHIGKDIETDIHLLGGKRDTCHNTDPRDTENHILEFFNYRLKRYSDENGNKVEIKDLNPVGEEDNGFQSTPILNLFYKNPNNPNSEEIRFDRILWRDTRAKKGVVDKKIEDSVTELEKQDFNVYMITSVDQENHFRKLYAYCAHEKYKNKNKFFGVALTKAMKLDWLRDNLMADANKQKDNEYARPDIVLCNLEEAVEFNNDTSIEYGGKTTETVYDSVVKELGKKFDTNLVVTDGAGLIRVYQKNADGTTKAYKFDVNKIERFSEHGTNAAGDIYTAYLFYTYIANKGDLKEAALVAAAGTQYCLEHRESQVDALTHLTKINEMMETESKKNVKYKKYDKNRKITDM